MCVRCGSVHEEGVGWIIPHSCVLSLQHVQRILPDFPALPVCHGTRSSLHNSFTLLLSIFHLFHIRLLVFWCRWSSQENSQNAPLVHATLETLLRFLNWIPLGYIFETKLISTLVYKVCVCVCALNIYC